MSPQVTKRKPATERIQVRLTAEAKAALERRAEAEGRTLSAMAGRLIVAGLGAGKKGKRK